MTLISCQSPKAYFDKAVKDKHFIPYELPMPSTRVGTVLRGNAKEMYLVATPERCFPDLAAANALRWTQPTDLPNQYKKVEFGFNLDVNPVLNTGSATLKFKTSAKYVKTVQLEFKGASVEFLEELNFFKYYNKGMSAECKDVLSQYPFIGQGLRIESMKFVFKDEFDAEINLTAKLSEIVDINAGVKWHIENNYTLVIDTPKYIGYRMAKLSTVGENTEILYASKADRKGKWIFKSVDPVKMMSEPFDGVDIAEPLNDLP